VIEVMIYSAILRHDSHKNEPARLQDSLISKTLEGVGEKRDESITSSACCIASSGKRSTDVLASG
jgi:hypothetical protein